MAIRRRARVTDHFAVIATFVVVVGGWEAIVRLSDISPIVLPSPSLIAVELWNGLVHGLFLKNLWYTMVETVGGFAIAAVLGIGLGALIAEVPWTRKAIYPYVIGFQTVPKIALAPLLVIWFGFGLTSKVIVAATVAFFPIIVNTIEGIANTESARVDMIRAMGAGRRETFRRVKVPSALPFIFAGLDAGIVLALLGAVVGEFIGSKVGLGNQMLVMNASLDIPGSFAILILLSLIGYLLHLILVAVQRRVVFWTGPKTALTQSA
jgi:NitT/TauT family transport system permease protein